MITAVDTNVLLDVLSADPTFAPRSLAALESCAAAGRLVVCEIVYAELAAAFDGDSHRLRAFMRDAEIGLDRSDEATLVEAGRMWRAWRTRGGSRSRLVADFRIAAHALSQAERLLSRDRGFYRDHFAQLTVLDPSEPA